MSLERSSFIRYSRTKWA